MTGRRSTISEVALDYARRKAKRRKTPKRRRLADWERADHTRGAGRDLLGVDLD